MSDYRNNRGRDSEKNGSVWRPAYQGNRRRRRYVVKRPVYKQPIVWLLTAMALCVVLICGSVMKWGVRNQGTTELDALGANASATPAVTNADGTLADSSESPAPTATPTVAPTPAPTVNEGPLVWDTENGESFHFDENCQGMRNATQETMLVAYNRGLKPCTVCVTSEEAVAERPDITVKALTTLPSTLGNVVIQDPQVFDIYDVTVQLGTLTNLNGAPALMVTGTTTGCLSLLYTNQPDLYDIKIHALLTNANGEVIWEADGDPVSYTQAGLDMTREISLVSAISDTEITGCKLTLLVYAVDGFEGVDADMAVLGMYEQTVS